MGSGISGVDLRLDIALGTPSQQDSPRSPSEGGTTFCSVFMCTIRSRNLQQKMCSPKRAPGERRANVRPAHSHFTLSLSVTEVTFFLVVGSVGVWARPESSPRVPVQGVGAQDWCVFVRHFRILCRKLIAHSVHALTDTRCELGVTQPLSRTTACPTPLCHTQ